MVRGVLMPDQRKEVPGDVNSSRQPEARKLFPGMKSKSVFNLYLQEKKTR